MNNLASAYKAAGKPELALPLLSEAYRIYEGKAGPRHPTTLTLASNLAFVCLETRQPERAVSLLQLSVDGQRALSKPNDPRFAGRLAIVATELIRHGQFSAAEVHLRESLTIHEQALPDDWSLFKTKSLLGAALAGQKKFEEAEALLIEGFEGMKARDDKIPAASKAWLPGAIKYLIDLYTLWEKPEEAAKWKAVLNAATGPREK
jgi:hypothetical protein